MSIRIVHVARKATTHKSWEQPTLAKAEEETNDDEILEVFRLELVNKASRKIEGNPAH